MDASNQKLTLKRTILMKTIVTAEWKEQAQQNFQMQINQIDGQIQQLELQARQAISEVQKQGFQSPGVDVTQQVDNIQMQVNNAKSQFLEQKNQILQQINRVQFLELDQEVDIGQVEGYFELKLGDNIYEKLQVDILLKDGIVQEIRGSI